MFDNQSDVNADLVHKYKRDYLFTSALVALVNLAGITVKDFKLFGSEISVEHPLVVYLFLIGTWVYFAIRFNTYIKIFSLLDQRWEVYLKNKIYEIANEHIIDVGHSEPKNFKITTQISSDSQSEMKEYFFEYDHAVHVGTADHQRSQVDAQLVSDWKEEYENRTEVRSSNRLESAFPSVVFWLAILSCLWLIRVELF